MNYGMRKINYKIKKMTIDALLKVMDNSPTRTYSNNFSQITRERFDMWVNYVFSILDILSDNNGMEIYIFNTKHEIMLISMDDNENYPLKTVRINQLLLDLANSISRL